MLLYGTAATKCLIGFNKKPIQKNTKRGIK